jgi:iron(III) transport system substrate-binding protein
MAAAPPPEPVTPALIEAAKKEGKVIYYTSTDLPVAEKLAKAFEAKYPGIAVRVERTGAERVFQRIGQEYASNIHAVDVVNSSDAAHFIVWKRDGILAPYVPEDVAKFYPAEHKDVDGQFASFRVWLSIIAYNTNLVKAEDAPKSFADLLDPKWKGKIVKAHPGYSGTIMTATYQMQRDLGWSISSSSPSRTSCRCSRRPIRRRSSRSRRARGDGRRQRVQHLPDEGGRPSGRAGLCHRRLAADHRAERHLQDLAQSERGKTVPVVLLQPRGQQLIIDVGGLRSVHPQTQGEGGPQAVQGHQDHEGRRRRGGKRERRDQGALYQDLPRLIRRQRCAHDIRIAPNLRRRNACRKIVALKPGALPAATTRKCEDLLIDVVGLVRHRAQRGLCQGALAGWDDDGPCTAIGHKRAR